MANDVAAALGDFRLFNYDRIYFRRESKEQADAVIAVLRRLVDGLLAEKWSTTEAVAYVAGMTDKFAFKLAVEHLDYPVALLPRGIDFSGGSADCCRRAPADLTTTPMISHVNADAVRDRRLGVLTSCSSLARLLSVVACELFCSGDVIAAVAAATAGAAAPVRPRSSPASSTGTTNFVDGEAPIDFKVSRYCKRSVFWSRWFATCRIVSRPDGVALCRQAAAPGAGLLRRGSPPAGYLRRG